jgi:hypothetical protein
MKYQDYIVCPLQSQISGYVDPLGALCRFEPQTYTEDQMKDIKKALEIDMTAHAMRVEITPYATKKEIPATLLEKTYQKFAAVKVKTPDGTVLFPSINANNLIGYMHCLLEHRLGRHCMHEARLWVGNEVISSRFHLFLYKALRSRLTLLIDERAITSLPNHNQTIEMRLESSLWCAPTSKPEENCDAPELVRRDPFPQGIFPDQTVSFKAYLLSEDVMTAVIGRPDVSCVSKRLEAQRGLHVWTVPARLTDLSVYLPEVKR